MFYQKGIGQDNLKYSWKIIDSIEIKSEQWDIDPMGQIILSNKDVLVKLDSNFNKLYYQSLKGFGNISSLDARHALKSMIFSENHQLIAFLDNTLTYYQPPKDLAEDNVYYATSVSYSNQSNRYWIFDGDNTSLFLFDQTQGNYQKIENLTGIIGSSGYLDLKEMENKLIIHDFNKGFYFFDLYGSLIDFIESPSSSSPFLLNDVLYYLSDKRLKRINIRTNEKDEIYLPDERISSFRILGDYFYFNTAESIKKYSLKSK